MYTPTDKDLAKWKKDHGETFTLNVGHLKTITKKVNGKDVQEQQMVAEHSCVVRKPNRKDVSMMRTLSEGDETYAKELLLDAIWLAGDEEIRTDDTLFLNVSPYLDHLLETKAIELKKN